MSSRTSASATDTRRRGPPLRARNGVQSGVQIERNRGQLRATPTRSRRLNPLPRNQNLPAGGRAVAGSNPVSPTHLRRNRLGPLRPAKPRPARHPGLSAAEKVPALQASFRARTVHGTVHALACTLFTEAAMMAQSPQQLVVGNAGSQWLSIRRSGAQRARPDELDGHLRRPPSEERVRLPPRCYGTCGSETSKHGRTLGPWRSRR